MPPQRLVQKIHSSRGDQTRQPSDYPSQASAAPAPQESWGQQAMDFGRKAWQGIQGVVGSQPGVMDDQVITGAAGALRRAGQRLSDLIPR